MHTIVHMRHSHNINVYYEYSGLEGIESPLCVVMRRVEVSELSEVVVSE